MTAMITGALEATTGKITPEDADPFRKGDLVVYPAHGVGLIDSVGFEEITGYRLNLIRISFDDNQMTLRVPVAQARAAGLQKLTSRKALAEALVILKGRPRVSRLMWTKRALPGEDQLGGSWDARRGDSRPPVCWRGFWQQLQPTKSVRACARSARC
jgi:CarD family transcriptional regulator